MGWLDRHDIADEIVVELVVECRIDCTLNRDQQERMPISGSLDHRLDGEIPAAPRSVSMMNGCPSRSDSHSAIKRPRISGELPGAIPMIKRTGRVG